eukprot:COSAG02_NODE_2423_length_8895_cov_3.455207_1_plen_156_part_00
MRKRLRVLLKGSPSLRYSTIASTSCYLWQLLYSKVRRRVHPKPGLGDDFSRTHLLLSRLKAREFIPGVPEPQRCLVGVPLAATRDIDIQSATVVSGSRVASKIWRFDRPCRGVRSYKMYPVQLTSHRPDATVVAAGKHSNVVCSRAMFGYSAGFD